MHRPGAIRLEALGQVDSLRLPVFILLFILIHSCSYRFSNSDRLQSQRSPRSLAVEGIFDTSRQVIPKDLLWREIQEAFANTGKVPLRPAKSADMLLRVHISDAAMAPNPGKFDTGVTDPEKPYAGDNLQPSRLPPLSRSFDDHSMREAVKTSFSVELWDLHSTKMVFQKNYQQSFQYRLTESKTSDRATLYSKENLDTEFTSSARLIARSIYLDVLGKL